MAGKFEIFKDKKGEFRFRLKASNGQTILASESYKTKASCKNGIASVQKNGTDPGRFERRPGKNGKFRFVLKAGNSQVIGTSEAYDSERAMESGIASVQKNSTTIKIDDTTG
ncbi:MAG: YegP family protein [Gammaproteobacteria bacterium]